MSLADALAREAVTVKGPRCMMCQLMDELEDGERETLTSALTDARFTSAAIFRALRAEGHAISVNAVARHRKGDCAKR